MPTTYTAADDETKELVRLVAEEFHPEITAEKVRFDLLMAHGAVDEATGLKIDDALIKNGVVCAAIVRVVNLRDRAKGCGDAEICFDGDRWADYAPKERVALIDHELTHLVMSRNSEGEIKRDDLARPKLKIRVHDFEIGGFAAVIRRHGSAALELQSLSRVGESLRQLEFDFSEAEGSGDFRLEIADAFRELMSNEGLVGAGTP